MIEFIDELLVNKYRPLNITHKSKLCVFNLEISLYKDGSLIAYGIIPAKYNDITEFLERHLGKRLNVERISIYRNKRLKHYQKKFGPHIKMEDICTQSER